MDPMVLVTRPSGVSPSTAQAWWEPRRLAGRESLRLLALKRYADGRSWMAVAPADLRSPLQMRDG